MPALLDLAIRAMVLLSIAWIGVALLRRRSASIQASIWTAALAGVLVLPVISTLGPAWPVPVLPPSGTDVVTNAQPLAADRPVTDLAAVREGIPNSAAETAKFTIDAAKITAPAWTPNWTTIAFAAVGFVTFILLIRIGVGYGRLRRTAQSAIEADSVWLALVDEVRSEMGIARPIPARVTDGTNVPAVTGLSRPVLLLPIETADWPLDIRRAVVIHELAHVARRDALGQLVGQVACALYWFVPLAWYGAGRAAAFRERASDDAVIQAGVRPSAYAESLIALARSSSLAGASPATVAMAESRIRERITAILMPSARRDRLTWRSAVTLLVLALGTTAIVGAVEPAERSNLQMEAAPSGSASSFPQPLATQLVDVAPRVVAAARAEPPITDTPIAPPAREVQGDRLCGGKGLDRSSSSIHDSHNERRWTVKLSGDGCSVDLLAEGKFEFNADFTDISRIDANGFFRVDVTDRGVRRQVNIESKNGTLTRTWRVDGRERQWDNEARTWFAAFLIELDRRTAIGVDVRLPILIRQGGVDAVLTETGLMASDYARGQYYLKLPKATKISPADTTRLLKQAASLSTSDHYMSELVRVYGAGAQDAAVRAALFDLVDRMNSDHYQATSIEAILGSAAPGPAELEVLVRLLSKIDSDHYKTQILLKVLKAPSLAPNHRAAVATTAASISSDHYAAEVLHALALKGIGDDAGRQAFFEAVGRVQSDHYRNAVLTAVLKGPSVTERDLLDVVANAKGISSDHYQAEVLERVARHQAATDRVRTAVLDATAGLSRHYLEQVKRAAGR